MQLKTKEEDESHIGRSISGFSTTRYCQDHNDQPEENNETGRDTESTTSSNQDEAVATHEPGV